MSDKLDFIIYFWFNHIIFCFFFFGSKCIRIGLAIKSYCFHRAITLAVARFRLSLLARRKRAIFHWWAVCNLNLMYIAHMHAAFPGVRDHFDSNEIAFVVAFYGYALVFCACVLCGFFFCFCLFWHWFLHIFYSIWFFSFDRYLS